MSLEDDFSRLITAVERRQRRSHPVDSGAPSNASAPASEGLVRELVESIRRYGWIVTKDWTKKKFSTYYESPWGQCDYTTRTIFYTSSVIKTERDKTRTIFTIGTDGEAEVLAHELGHMILHPYERPLGRWYKSDKEQEAQAVSYLVCSNFNVNVLPHSITYIAHYSKTCLAIKREKERILQASSIIINAIYGNELQPLEAPLHKTERYYKMKLGRWKSFYNKMITAQKNQVDTILYNRTYYRVSEENVQAICREIEWNQGMLLDVQKEKHL